MPQGQTVDVRERQFVVQLNAYSTDVCHLIHGKVATQST
jgi:hypothetical protein